MREPILLECTECKNRNYSYMKDKRKHKEKLELKKYCKFCRKHILHRETKGK